MARRSRGLAVSLLILPLLPNLAAAAPDVPALLRLSESFEARLEAERPALYRQLLLSTDPAVARLNADPSTQLIRIDRTGMPRYYSTENVDAAATISTDRVHPGGGAGFSLTGSGTVLGQLGVWDGGAVRTSHVEFGGRATQMDGASSLTSHGTHVAGTMIAGGDDADALGMSYEAEIGCYDWSNDTGEMASAAAAGLLISNHSYGFSAGWRFSSGQWYWYGDVSISTTEDYGFGFYEQTAQELDQVAHDAPEYLIVMSAGNDRGSGPAPGTSHLYWDGSWVSSNDVREIDGGADGGYDSINWTKVAKNILAVGAVEDIAGGYSSPPDVDVTSFSNWGPTDDGRIKPDITANGRSLYSCTAGSNTAYSTFSGTSMASPNASGSANLVNEHWRSTHAATMRSATLKAILLHTADEAGDSDGPDYEHGWGLMNTESAVQMVEDDAMAASGTQHVIEDQLGDGETDVWTLPVDSAGPVKVTLTWTDVPGTPPPPSLNPADLMLVNDLDLRVTDGGSTHEPWILDPANPADAATTGDNFRDNVEQVYVASLPAGTWTIEVSHKGTLTGGSQAYSLVASTPILTEDPAVSAPELAERGPTRPIAYPNPFVASTTVAFRTVATSAVTVELHDVAGRRVATLVDRQVLDAGTHRVAWDGRGADGTPLPAGVYFTRVTADGVTTSGKIVRVDAR